MRKIITLFLVFNTIILLLTSCPMDYAIWIELKNKSSQSVYCIPPALPPHIYTADTTLPKSYEFQRLIPPNNTNIVITYGSRRSFQFIYDYYDTDTLSLFVLDSKTVDTLPWDSIVCNYLILQRYDLTVDDANKALVVFPPDSSMKHIHMWPPYGTYDKHGRRKDTK